jgi:hypothetical protein
MMDNSELRTGYQSLGLGLVVASSTSEGHISFIFRTEHGWGSRTSGSSLGASYVYRTV